MPVRARGQKVWNDALADDSEQWLEVCEGWADDLEGLFRNREVDFICPL